MSIIAWRKPSRSCSEGDCAEVAGWRASSRSAGNGACAEVASWRKSAHGEAGNCAEARACRHGVAVRDSKDPGGPVLTFSGSTWGRFLAEVRRTAVPA